MTAIETALAVCQWVRGSTHLSQVFISTDMQITDHLQIEIQHLIEISALGSCFRQDHWKMKADCTDIETSDKYRCIFIICRIHTAAFIPRT